MRQSVTRLKERISLWASENEAELLILAICMIAVALVCVGFFASWIGSGYMHASAIGMVLSVPIALLMTAGSYYWDRMYTCSTQGGMEPFSEVPGMFGAALSGMLFVCLGLGCGFSLWAGAVAENILFQGWLVALLTSLGMCGGTIIGVMLYPYLYVITVKALRRLKTRGPKHQQGMTLC